ncbi:MAG: phosphatase PAP2 family protein [Gammaproteobacteria bacterium]|jgi:membrane-associated phospholipid phosphatase|tara:strand:+ start:2170 stop:2871 length:702 start_codon:yes stop_codon:yes gene_type:complete
MTINNYSLLSLIFFALALLVKSVPAIDVVSLKILNSLMFNEIFFSYFTEIGNGLICLALIIPLLSFLSFKSNLNNVKVQTLVMAGLVVGIIVKTLKELASFSVRPGFYKFEDINYLEPIFSYSSFPSGHAATILGISLVWISLATKHINTKFSIAVASIVLVLALSVSLSRIVIGAHWLSDILGSIAVAFLILNIIELEAMKEILFTNNLSKYISYFLIGISWLYIISQGTVY